MTGSSDDKGSVLPDNVMCSKCNESVEHTHCLPCAHACCIGCMSNDSNVKFIKAQKKYLICCPVCEEATLTTVQECESFIELIKKFQSDKESADEQNVLYKDMFFRPPYCINRMIGCSDSLLVKIKNGVVFFCFLLAFNSYGTTQSCSSFGIQGLLILAIATGTILTDNMRDPGLYKGGFFDVYGLLTALSSLVYIALLFFLNVFNSCVCSYVVWTLLICVAVEEIGAYLFLSFNEP